MPIETESSNIDFRWKLLPSENNQEGVFFSLRLHKTPEYGWTLSFMNDNSEVEFSLPALMFPEVASHIEEYMNPPTTAPKAKSGSPVKLGSKIGLPQVYRASGLPSQAVPRSQTVPTPTAARTVQSSRPDGRGAIPTVPKVKAEGLNKEFEAPEVQIDADYEGQEGVFMPPGHDPSSVEFDENAPVFQSFTAPPVKPVKVAEKEVISEEENARIWAERQAAASNPARKPGIQKRHSNGASE